MRPAGTPGRDPQSRRLIIIGAARSGTKLLRDALAVAAGAGKVPYDINYVWRYGNEDRTDDILDPADVDAGARRFIRRFVDGYAGGNPRVVIEKTVSNSLRLPAVATVFPDALYVHLVRDGVDVIESTMRQWREPADLRYLLAKLGHVPLRLLPRHGATSLRSLASRWTTKDHRVGSWGPRYPGMDDDLKRLGLLLVCARQWRIAVTAARSSFEYLGLPMIEVRYERLVIDPLTEVDRIARFAGLSTSPRQLEAAARLVHPARHSSGRRLLTSAELSTVNSQVGELLSDLNYDRPLSIEPFG